MKEAVTTSLCRTKLSLQSSILHHFLPLFHFLLLHLLLLVLLLPLQCFAAFATFRALAARRLAAFGTFLLTSSGPLAFLCDHLLLLLLLLVVTVMVVVCELTTLVRVFNDSWFCWA